MQCELRYGRGTVTVDIPDRNLARVLRMTRLPVLGDPAESTRAALKNPVDAPPLAELARGRCRACIVVSDLTRPVPNAVLLPPILDELAAAGMAPEQILVLVATGLHRANSECELADMGLDVAIQRGIRVENHVAKDMASQTQVGDTSLGIPVWVDTRFVDADLRVLTGLVEPHLMAGYSGGRKAICPGICGAETIMSWHCPEILEPPSSSQGVLQGNRVHEQALEAAALAGGADMIVNCTLDERRNVTGVFAGEMVSAHMQAVARAELQTKVVLDTPVDIVVTSAAGYPLDLTYYQGIKGMAGAAPIVKPGGTIIIAQENAEGIGGEEFTSLLLGSEDIHATMERAVREKRRCVDLWQFHVLEKVLRKCEVWNYTESIDPETQAKLFVRPLESLEQGIAEAIEKHGPEARIAAIPEGPYVLACLRGDLAGSQSIAEMMA